LLGWLAAWVACVPIRAKGDFTQAKETIIQGPFSPEAVRRFEEAIEPRFALHAVEPFSPTLTDELFGCRSPRVHPRQDFDPSHSVATQPPEQDHDSQHHGRLPVINTTSNGCSVARTRRVRHKLGRLVVRSLCVLQVTSLEPLARLNKRERGHCRGYWGSPRLTATVHVVAQSSTHAVVAPVGVRFPMFSCWGLKYRYFCLIKC
jgi:hypothetical protein